MRQRTFWLFVAGLAHVAIPAASDAQIGGRPNSRQVAVAWNDFDSGSGFVRAFSAAAPWDFVSDPIPVGINPIMRYAGNRLFVISQDNMVRTIDPATWAVDQSYPLPAGGEPLDIAVVTNETAYITRAGATHLLRLDLNTGATENAIDLSPFADADGVPDMATMVVSEGRLFVQIQRLNLDIPGYVPPAMIAVVDLTSEQLFDVDPIEPGTQAIELEGTAPKHKMQVVPETRQLFVSATGGVFDEGGIEIVDLDTLESQGLEILEADDLTGADIGPFVMVTPEDGFLAFSTDFTISSHLHAWAIGHGVDPDPLFVAADYLAPTIEFDPRSNNIFFPVGGNIDTGVHVFDATTGEQLTMHLIPTSGPPTDIAVIRLVPEPTTVALAVIFGVMLLHCSQRRR
jgi:hypothetical protein